MKNMGICTATGLARAAIRGGLDPREAFSMSDLYIQRLELLRDVFSVERLIQDMMLDFAERVEKLLRPEGGGSQFYRRCAQFVSENLFATIRAEDMAAKLGYNRTYLCSRFKQEAGISLTQFIRKEKSVRQNACFNLRIRTSDRSQRCWIFLPEPLSDGIQENCRRDAHGLPEADQNPIAAMNQIF